MPLRPVTRDRCPGPFSLRQKVPRAKLVLPLRSPSGEREKKEVEYGSAQPRGTSLRHNYGANRRQEYKARRFVGRTSWKRILFFT